MSEFEDRVNSILNDPDQMDKITKIAQSLMGGEQAEPRSGAETIPLPRSWARAATRWRRWAG